MKLLLDSLLPPQKLLSTVCPHSTWRKQEQDTKVNVVIKYQTGRLGYNWKRGWVAGVYFSTGEIRIQRKED